MKKKIKINNYQKLKTAFSLIELSIVILIIGILVAGVTQSTRLIKQIRLSAARSITNSAPIASISGLVGWWESTLENSFDRAETSDLSPITNWYDQNPTAINKINLNQLTSTSKPIYVENGMNNLPALKFDGGDRFITNNFFSENFSLFVVLSTTSPGFGSSSSQAYLGSIIVGSDVAGGANDIIPLAIGGGYLKIFVGNPETTLSSSLTVIDNAPKIIFVSRNLTNGARNIMINNANSVSDNNGSAGILLNANPQSAIGGDVAGPTYFTGNIAEVIVFNRVLNTEERTSISQYLGKKYGLKI